MKQLSNKQTNGSFPIWTASLPDSPLGALTCAVTEAGLRSVHFDSEEKVRDWIKPSGMPPPQDVRETLQEAQGQITSYLQGNLKAFRLPFDLRGCSDFQQQVLAEVDRIPYGSVTSYGQIANLLGGPRMARAVGRAVGANPLPLVIPCHRVVAANGQMGGYSGRGGIKTKTWLLRLEGHLLVAEELA